jgi:hypothetical protein
MELTLCCGFALDSLHSYILNLRKGHHLPLYTYFGSLHDDYMEIIIFFEILKCESNFEVMNLLTLWAHNFLM